MKYGDRLIKRLNVRTYDEYDYHFWGMVDLKALSFMVGLADTLFIPVMDGPLSILDYKKYCSGKIPLN